MSTSVFAQDSRTAERDARNRARLASDARKTLRLSDATRKTFVAPGRFSGAMVDEAVATTRELRFTRMPFFGPALAGLVGAGSVTLSGHPELAAKVGLKSAAESAIPGSADRFMDIRTHRGLHQAVDVIRTFSGTIAFGAQTVAITAVALSALTSWTGIGGITLGAIAAGAEATALGFTGVQLIADAAEAGFHKSNATTTHAAKEQITQRKSQPNTNSQPNTDHKSATLQKTPRNHRVLEKRRKDSALPFDPLHRICLRNGPCVRIRTDLRSQDTYSPH